MSSEFRVEPGGNQADWQQGAGYRPVTPTVVEAETGGSQVARLAWTTD